MTKSKNKLKSTDARLERIESKVMAPAARHIEPDIISFAENTLGLKPLDLWQQQLLTASERKVVLNIARQCGKSSMAAAFSIYEACTQPGSLTLLVSPSQRQSLLLYNKVMDYFSMAGRPVDVVKETATELFLANGSKIYSLPSSEGQIRGFSKPSTIIIDEAARADSVLIAAALMPMLLLSETSRIWLISTPWGYGSFYADRWHEHDNGWLKIKVTAYECPRISKASIETQRRNLLDYQFKAEIECSFEASQLSLLSESAIQALFSEKVDEWSL